MKQIESDGEENYFFLAFTFSILFFCVYRTIVQQIDQRKTNSNTGKILTHVQKLFRFHPDL